MNYYEQFNIFTGRSTRYISVYIFPEIKQTHILVYNEKGKRLYYVFLDDKNIRNKQKLPEYLNKIIDNIKILFL